MSDGRCALHWWKPTARRDRSCACPRYVGGIVTAGQMLKVGEAGEEQVIILRNPREVSVA